jgi:nicotinate-nucleotide pyrophosphorylase (carboxylating)
MPFEKMGDGDHSSLACIPASAEGKTKLLVKDDGLSQVLELQLIFQYMIQI